jgi:flagellar basal-body rod protein FlgG
MPDGTTAYTRDGSFHMSSTGQVVTSSGYTVQPAITVPANTLSITVASDGTVSVTQSGSSATTTVGTLQLANFVNPAGLSAQGQNLFVETAASGTASTGAPGLNGLGTLNQGYVETSNVNVAEELVNMIQAQRSYELNSKAITTTDQMLQSLTQL